MKNGISLNTVVVVSKDQVSCDLGEESVILNSASGIYYGLNGVGARVWSLIQQPQRIEEVLGVLLDEYEVEPLRCQDELVALLNELQDKGLINVKSATLA
jgi:hypothetical protein